MAGRKLETQPDEQAIQYPSKVIELAHRIEKLANKSSGNYTQFCLNLERNILDWLSAYNLPIR